MNKELIERLAKEAGIDIHRDTLCRNEGWTKPMEKFAALIAEECAKKADYWGQIGNGPHPEHVCGQYIAAAIRAIFKPV